MIGAPHLQLPAPGKLPAAKVIPTSLLNVYRVVSIVNGKLVSNTNRILVGTDARA